MATSDNPTDFLSKLGETFSSVKLGSGVNGRTGQAMLMLLIVWGVIAWRWSDSIVLDAGLLLVGSIASGVFLTWMRSTQSFAERNPAQAMLEGAQFIEYKKFEAQAKGIGVVPAAPLTTDPTKPIVPMSAIHGSGGPDVAQ